MSYTAHGLSAASSVDFTSLDGIADQISAALPVFTSETGYYVGRLSSDNPTAYAQFRPVYDRLLAGIIDWRSKYTKMSDPNYAASVDDTAWTNAANQLAQNGQDLLDALAALHGSVQRSDAWSQVYNFATSAVSITATTAAITLPVAVAHAAATGYKAGVSAANTVVSDVGGILKNAGSQIGGTLGNLTGPVKTILYVGAGVAILYFLAPAIKALSMSKGKA